MPTDRAWDGMPDPTPVHQPGRRDRPGVYLTQTLQAIVNGHKQSQIDDLLPWNYNAKV